MYRYDRKKNLTVQSGIKRLISTILLIINTLLNFPYFNSYKRERAHYTRIFCKLFSLAPELRKNVWRAKDIGALPKSRAQRVSYSSKNLSNSTLMGVIIVYLQKQLCNQVSNLSYLEQLLSKIFRADSENPEHPERFSRTKFEFCARSLEKEKMSEEYY